MGPRKLVLVVVGAAALVVGPARPLVHGQAYRSGVDLVVVPATVLDANGRLVLGLSQADFSIFEDGVEQRIVQFSAERVPVSLGLVVDVSDSMYGVRIAAARRAIDTFVLDLLEEDDEAFLMVFNHEPTIKATWTRPRALAGRLNGIVPSGGTSMFDAVIKAAAMFDKRRHQRCGMVLISDGDDSGSDASLQDALRRMNQTDAFLYGVAIDAPQGPAINRRSFSPESLSEISSQSGGYAEVVHDSSELTAAVERIANELNHQYTLAYAPGRQPDGQYHSIRVRTRDAGQTVRSRRGYTHVRAKAGGPSR